MSENVELMRAEYLKRNLHYFVRYFWDIINTEKYVDNWHIKFLCDELQEVVYKIRDRQPYDADLVINIPPASSKSTIVTIMLPAWAWIIDPSFRVITSSYSGSLSTDHAIKSRDIIRSDKFRALFPELEIRKDFDNKTHYKNKFNGERYATSVGGTITGLHGHIIIVDDPLNPKEASSEVERAKANEYITSTLSTRKVDKEVAPLILIMQRLHVDDCTGMLLEQAKRGRKVKHICLPAEISPALKPAHLKENYVNDLLDAKRMNRRVLDDLKINLGSYQYAGQMMQEPAPLDGGIWKKWLRPFTKLPTDDKGQPLPMLKIGTDWDLAYTEKETNSASAYVTAGVIGNDMYVTELGFAWLEFPKLMEYMKSKKPTHYIEAKASGKSAKQVLSNQGINAVEVDVSGGDKTARATMATPYAEAGRIYVAEHLLDLLYNHEKQGILRFPNNHNDDLHDAFVQAVNRLLNQPQVFVF